VKITSISHIGLGYTPGSQERYGSAQAEINSRQFSVVIVETDTGVQGIGEARGPVSLVRAAVEFVSGAILGHDVDECPHIWARTVSGSYHFAGDRLLTAAYSGVDIAIHDLIGRSRGVPVHMLLGAPAAGREVVPYATSGWFTPDGLAGLERQLQELPDGMAAVKVKIGRGPVDDEARMGLARDVLGPDAVLMADANANYTADLALASMTRIRDCDIEWYEEPVPPWDLAGYRWLHDRAGMALAAGEAHAGRSEFATLIGANAVDVVQPNLCACGGFAAASSVADLAHAANRRVVPAVWDSGIGLTAALHWVQSISPEAASSSYPPRPRWIEYDVSPNPLRDELLIRPPRIVNGRIMPAEGPGLGLELNRDVVQRYTFLPQQTWSS